MNEPARIGPASRALALEPRDLQEAMRFAELLADSGMVPKDFVGKPGACLVAIQWGREVGLPPLQAMQTIAVINGRPSLWGDGALAVVRSHPAFVGIREWMEGEGEARTAWCELTRQGEEPVRRSFALADAKRAKLTDKTGPWKDYPERMLQMRARSWAMRDCFPDALRGLHVAEEAADMAREVRDVPNTAQPEPRTIAARPGSLLEHAARVTGATVEHPPEPLPEEGLPLRYLDGRVVEVRRGVKTGASALVLWQRAAERQVSEAPSAEALRGWRVLNGPDFGSIASRDDAHLAAVRHVEKAIDARLAVLRDREAEAAALAAEAQPETPQGGQADEQRPGHSVSGPGTPPGAA